MVEKSRVAHYVGRLYYWLTERGRRKFLEPKLWGSLGKAKHWKKNCNFFFSINFTQIFRICPKMLQFLTYLLYKQIIEMRRSQNLRRPLSVPCPTQCYSQIIFTLGIMGSMWDKSVWSVQIRSDILKGMQKIFCNLKFW